MAKETNMHTIETEVKGIAKAVGASLKRSGHQVPHSVLLHALAAALDKRDWHKLKAALSGGTEPELAHTTEPGTRLSVTRYSPTLLNLLRLAYLLKRPLPSVPEDDAAAIAAVAAAVGKFEGAVSFKNLYLPVTFNPATGALDEPQDVVRRTMGIGNLSFANFHFEAPFGLLKLEAEYRSDAGWRLSERGEQQLYCALQATVPDLVLLSDENLPSIGPGSVLKEMMAGLPSELQVVHRKAPAQTGPAVKARFWTDDHRFEVDFDAQAYFAQAHVDDLLAIAEVGFSGDYCTDNVAEFMQGRNAEIDEGFDYIHALQKANLRDPVGFECRVDQEDYFRWMDVHHRSELAQWLCVRADVTLAEAQEEEIRGRWDWFTTDSASDSSFTTQEEAALDAYEQLGLLQQAIDGEL